MEGFEWVMELKDGMSGPARQMTASLRSVEAEMRKLQAVQQSYKDNGLAQHARIAGTEIAHLRLQAGELRAGLKDLKGDGESTFLGMFKAMSLVEVFKKVAEAVWEAVKALGELVLEGAKMAIEAGEMRTHLTEMFTGLSGGEEAGKAMYDLIQKLRVVLPQSEKDLSSWAAKLMGAGMVDPRNVQESIKAMASASALMGGGEQGAAAAEKISNLIAKSLEGGKFKGMAKTLVGTGISADDLAKQLGMTPANFQVAFRKGTIEANRGIDALNAVLQRKGAGALEGTMNELPTMFAKAKEFLAHLFDGVNVKPLTDAFRQMVSVLDSTRPSGRAMKLTITDAFNWIMKVGGEAIHALTMGFLYLELGVLKVMHYMAPLILMFRRFMADGTMLFVMRTIVEKIAVTFVILAAVLGSIVAVIVAMGTAFMWAVEKALELKAAITGVSTAAPNMTKVVSSGLSTFGGTPAAMTAPAHAMGGTVMQPAPGEVFASVAPGETIVPRGGFDVPRGGPPSPPARAPVSIDVGGIHIDGAGKSAGEILVMLESSLADLFERAALEAGG